MKIVAAMGLLLILSVPHGARAHEPTADTQPASYATEVGERRSISLSDGTRVEMNTRSIISERFDDSNRVIVQLEGDVLFDIGADDTRPFEVRVGGVQIHSTGGKFFVLRRAKEIGVTVLQGAATVFREQDSEGVVEHRRLGRIEASHEALVHTEGEGMSMEPRQSDARTLRRRLAWTEGKVWFEGESVAEVVAEINRYNRHQLVLCPQQGGTLPIGGIFEPTDIHNLLLALDRLGIHDVTPNNEGGDGGCPRSASTNPDFNGGATVQAGVFHSMRRGDLKFIHR